MKKNFTATIIGLFIFIGSYGQELANFRRAPVVSPKSERKQFIQDIGSPGQAGHVVWLLDEKLL